MGATDASCAGTLSAKLAAGEFISAPGVFELISARIADDMGFDALYMTGYGAVASLLGLPDAGLATFSQMLDRVATICERTTTPLIADADTGYGGPLNVRHTVRGYERAGAAAIQIEDQQFPKKCGHTQGRRVVPLDEMLTKIKVACDTRESDDFLIIARTDARSDYGLDEAVKRGQAFASAGADIVFVESPESEQEMTALCRAIDKPLLANMVDGGRTPILTKPQLIECGYQLAIFPGTGFLAMGAALRGAYRHIQQTGSSHGIDVALDDFQSFNELMGFEDVWAFEKRYG